MRRLPAIRRKGNYISEIDSARKRQRQYGDEEPLEYVDDLHGGGVLLESAPSSGKIMTRRCRIVRQRDLKHEPEFYQQRRSRVLKAEPLVSRTYYGGTTAYYSGGSGGLCVDKFVRKSVPPQHQDYAIYDEMDEYQESPYYANDLEGVSPLYVMAQHHQPRHNGGPLYRRLSTSGGAVWGNSKGDDGSGGSGVVSDAILVTDNNEIMVAEPSPPTDSSSAKMVHHHNHHMNDGVGSMDGEVIRRDFSSNVHEVVDYNTRRLSAGAYAYDDEIQEQIEVVDDDDSGGGGGEPLEDELAHHHQHHSYNNKFVSAEAPIDLHRLYDEMVKCKDGSNEELIEQFFADPEMAYPLNVIDLVNGAVNASPEANAQAIASLAMQINVLKRDLLRVRQELADWRTVCAAKEGPFVTPGRKFQPLGEVCRDWKISARPPLREVDLVMVARQLSNYRTGGKQQQRNEDLIRRFIRLSLEKLIPHEVVREFTVKNRIQSRKDKARDIGEFAKNQITGIVLDLMGLYNVNELDERALTERGHYFNLANKLMKYAMNDMRRLSPKRREPPPI